ncbi:MAG: YidC/Oxa1 family membrane protein insertase [Treponema sp.]|jgi:YidC/Oxa1 family membrane protein insertase|nr:YidC/Oxa1 family membrane protein insertase [Treponema sp.]
MFTILYTIIIYPLVQIIETVYLAAAKLFDRPGLSIISVSVAVTFLCLPLYIVAEKWQKKERETFGRLKPKIDKIRAVFRGDERYMILSVYYRQHHYHPVYALRTSFGILIQIPFFMAAYTYLSHLEAIRGVPFLFIRDLGLPDALFPLQGGVHVNVLPVVMTLINCAAGAIYTRGLPARDKIQLYGMAAVFLVLLYNSPSGLVLYWTMNNVFSLVKNIFYRLKRPLLVLYVLSCLFVIFSGIFLVFIHPGDISNRLILFSAALIIPAFPLFLSLYRKLLETILDPIFSKDRLRTSLYILALAVLCVSLGFVIPSYVIRSSPQEFSFIESVRSPFAFLFTSLLQAAGFCLFWPLCVYFLFGRKVQTFLAVAAAVISPGCLVNAFCFSGDYGELSSILTFSNGGVIKPEPAGAAVNAAVLLLSAVIILVLLRYRQKILLALFSILLAALAGVSVIHAVTIGTGYARYRDILAFPGAPGDIGADSPRKENAVSPIFHLSQGGKNVIVIMLDRAVSGFIPEIFSEDPRLGEKYRGFTYYPNTVSFNGFTLMGAPPLFGGYEYTPSNINSRPDEPLVKKHDEALLLMPRVFSENGYSVTVTDPSWAGYSWVPDLRIFRDYPGIRAYNTIRTYTDVWISRNNFPELQLKSKILKRNFIWFSFFKISPLVLRDAVYNDGNYWSTDKGSTDFRLILNNYAVLDLLPELTDLKPEKENSFVLLVNELTHEPGFLQAPGYTPVPLVTDRGTSKYAGIINYPANMASIKKLGEWFDFLRGQGVYDNSRIIIVSDHGAGINTGSFGSGLPFQGETYNPLLMVKDFNASLPFAGEESFMTNADVPFLAMENIIANPVNPFTGRTISSDGKKDPLFVNTSSKWMPGEHRQNTFTINPEEWYTVHDNIFDAKNWEQRPWN